MYRHRPQSPGQFENGLTRAARKRPGGAAGLGGVGSGLELAAGSEARRCGSPTLPSTRPLISRLVNALHVSATAAPFSPRPGVVDAVTDAAILDILRLVPPDLCASCVGRVFARTEPAPSNGDRGRALRPAAPDSSPACPLCEGIPTRVPRYADLCDEAVQDVEFRTFLVGSVFFIELRRREDALYERLADAHPAHRRERREGEAAAPPFALAEYLKAEVNREVGKLLERRWGKQVEFGRADVMLTVDTRLDHIRTQIASVLVRGRYRKLDRTLPQTHWPCRTCEGLGCRRCGMLGRVYASSVEELVAAPFVEAAKATGESFHGMGREDIDALMLGSGRPFVLELKSPRRRTLDLRTLAQQATADSTGRIEVLDAQPGAPDDPARYKAADPDKTYRARCVADAAVPDVSLINLIPSFRELQLDQRTPERVSHRRADLVRRRRVHEVRLLSHEGDRFELEIRAEAGTYIKEFVSGDQGRTRPSLSQALGIPVRVEELDVIHVDWTE